MTHVIELRAKNFGKIFSCTIRPEPNKPVVRIGGLNDQGKSTVLKCLWTLFEGAAAAPSIPIKKGEREAVIFGDLGDYKVERRFARVGDTDEVTHDLHITMADGTPVRAKKHTFLKELVGSVEGLSWDPLAFIKMKPRDQFDMLKKFVSDFNFDDNAAQRQKAYTERTDVNRRGAEQKTLADAIKLPPGKCPAAIDTASLLTQLEEANRHNAEIGPERERRGRMIFDIAKKREEVAQLRDRIDRLEAEAKAAEAQMVALPPIPEPKDTTAIREEIKRAEQVLATRVLFARRHEYETKAEELEFEATTLSTTITSLDQARIDAVARAKMPIDGISFGHNEILFNGFPLGQAARSQQIKVSMAVGMSLSPKLRVMLIDEGSELDSTSRQVVNDMAAANDYQVWITHVDETGDDSDFVMVDGHLRESA